MQVSWVHQAGYFFLSFLSVTRQPWAIYKPPKRKKSIMTYIIYLIHDWNKWIWGEEIETYALLFSLRGRNMRDNQPSLLRSVQLESLLGSTQPPLPISHFKPFPSRFRTFPSITVHRVLRRRISPWPAESCWWMKWYALPSGLPYGLLARTNAGSLYSTMGGWVSLLRH